MFALPAVKPQVKTGAHASYNSLRQDPPAFINSGVHQPVPPSDAHVGAWDFSKIPLHPSGRTAGSVSPSRIPVPRLPGALQAKLKVGSVNDPLEHEADRVADQVMRMPAAASFASAPPQISRKCADCEGDEQLQMKPAGAASGARLSAVHEVLSSPGQPLDGLSRAFFEPRFGRDFSQVRVHRGAAAEHSAQDVNARAYTVEHSIVFGAGAPAPVTDDGRRLLAHELTHVVQQAGNRTGPGLTPRSAADATLARDGGEEARDEDFEPAEGGEEAAEGEGGSVFTRPPGRTYTPGPNDRLEGNQTPPAATNPTEDWRPDPNPAVSPSPYRDEGSRTKWGAATQYAAAQKQAAGLRYNLESTPTATLDRGGRAPDFVTISPKTAYYDVTAVDAYVWDELKHARIEYSPRYFHLLDAIDYDFALATTPDEEIGVLLSYVPELIPTPRAGLPLDYVFNDRMYHPKLPRGQRAIGRFVIYDLVTKATLDARVSEFAAQFTKRRRQEREQAEAAVLAEAENVALKGGKRKQGACTWKRTSPPSGNKYQDYHNKFAQHVAAAKGFGKVTDELTYTTPEGVSYPFDTYNPSNKKEVWEVKTYHEWTSETGIATAPFRIKNFSERIQDLEEQRLRGLYIASRCNLNFRYVVDNYQALNGLRDAWILPPVEYISYPGE